MASNSTSTMLGFDLSPIVSGDKLKSIQRGVMYSGLLLPFVGHEYTLKKKKVTAV